MNSRSKIAASRRTTTRPCTFELLEQRHLLASLLSATLVDHQLRIEGTDLADTIVVRQTKNLITVQGAAITCGAARLSQVSAGLVSSIRINAWTGDDLIRLDYTKLLKPTWIYAGYGNDRIWGSGAGDTIFGELGNDRVWACGGNDFVYGGDGNDSLDAGAGNDCLWGGNGNDTLWGIAGRNTLYGDAGDDRIEGGTGNDAVFGADGADLLLGFKGNDQIDGGNGNDRIEGGVGNDTLFGLAGNDVLYGQAGNDRLEGNLGDDTLWGGDGNDLLLGFEGNDAIHGDKGNDRLEGGLGNDTLWGGDGNDTLLGFEGNDTAYGENGNDRLEGGIGTDLLYGGQGADHVYGGAGNDRLWGNEGNDTVSGEAGDDDLYAGAGNDSLFGGSGRDLFEGASGFDMFRDDFNLRCPVVNGTSQSDVFQAESGTCTINAAMAGAARASNIGDSIRYLGNNRFNVRMFKAGREYFDRVFFDGTWTDDDSQPAYDGAGRNIGDFWNVVLQRAYIHSFGIDPGKRSTTWDKVTTAWHNPTEAIKRITNWNTNFTPNSRASLAALAGALNNRHGIVVAYTWCNGRKCDSGLVEKHSYTVVGVDAARGTVTVRNPWGADGRSGAIQGANDGVFMVSWATFVRNFEGYSAGVRS